jgi:ABC-2 type transport system permease protein
VRLMMQRLDVIKTYPLRGWQVVLGEILAPIVLITAAEWLVLAILAVATAALTGKYASTALLSSVGLVSAGLLVPPVVGLMTGIPFAATLYFPTWISAASQGSGVDAMGQRLIFAGGYVVVLIVALLPAALAAAVPYFIVLWLVEMQAAALFAGAVAASLVLVGELAAVIWWLGGRYERFDLSTELPQ